MTTFTASFASRAAAFACALVASATVLGATVAGMQPQTDAAPQIVVLDTVTVTAARVN